MSTRITRLHRRLRLLPRQHKLSAGEMPSGTGLTAHFDDDEGDDDPWSDEQPAPDYPTWDDFDLEPPDDEPDPEDGDFWIDPDEFTDPWNYAGRMAEE